MTTVRRVLRRTVSFAGLAAILLWPPAAIAQQMTAERLLHARDEPSNWLMNLGSYDGARYSRLDEIDRDSVGRLVELYSVPLGGLFQGGGNFRDTLPISPLVEDGFIYIVDGSGDIYKLDAGDRGRAVWRNQGTQNLDNWLEPSRGLALYRQFVIASTADGSLRWINKETGETIRSATIGDPAEGYTIVAPPLVIEDRIIVGGGGQDRGARGRIDAVDARTGEPLWRVDTVGESAIGGGAFLQTGVYDPSSGLTIWSSGHKEPRFDVAAEDAANYANSAIAIDVMTGSVRWRHKYVADADLNGFSSAGPQQIVPRDGTSAIVQFGNDGIYRVLDGADGSLLSATQHVVGAVATADANPVFDVSWRDRADCPNIRSVVAFASTYSERTGLSYGAGADGCLTEGIPAIKTRSAPGWLGAYYAGAAADLGMLSAIDPASGTLVAQRLFDFPLHSGALATAGGLVFTTTAEGTLHALNDETLETVWSHKLGSLTAVPPVTFAVGGRQFIAVVVGGNSFTSELAYRPPEMEITEPIFALVVLGLRADE